MGREVTRQHVKLPSWNLHMFGLRSRIQGGELLIQLRGMARLNSSLRAG
jgi:hypothetical protein